MRRPVPLSCHMIRTPGGVRPGSHHRMGRGPRLGVSDRHDVNVAISTSGTPRHRPRAAVRPSPRLRRSRPPSLESDATDHVAQVDLPVETSRPPFFIASATVACASFSASVAADARNRTSAPAMPSISRIDASSCCTTRSTRSAGTLPAKARRRHRRCAGGTGVLLMRRVQRVEASPEAVGLDRPLRHDGLLATQRPNRAYKDSEKCELRRQQLPLSVHEPLRVPSAGVAHRRFHQAPRNHGSVSRRHAADIASGTHRRGDALNHPLCWMAARPTHRRLGRWRECVRRCG